MPSLKSVAESDAFLDPSVKPASSRVFIDTIPVIRQVPSISTWPEIEDAAEPILESGLYKGKPAKDVAAELEKATTPIFARARARMAELRFAGSGRTTEQSVHFAASTSRWPTASSSSSSAPPAAVRARPCERPPGWRTSPTGRSTSATGR